MAYLAATILVIGLSLLLLSRAPGFLMLPQWLRPASWRQSEPEQQPTVSTTRDRVKRRSLSADGDDSSEHESTPKASPSNGHINVPAFSLSEHSGSEEPSSENEQTWPSFPAVNSAQRVQAASGPVKPALPTPQADPSTLMPPPARPTPKPASSAASGLRVPTTGPLPNRGPPANSQQRVGGGLSPSGAVPTPNRRGKVLLAPGHSPMDWAALARKNNLSGVDTFQRVTPSALKTKTGRKGKPAWSSWHGKVYNITPYLPFHPGGEAELMKAAGRDGQKLFEEVHPWVNWENMLNTCLVGVMVPEDYGKQLDGGSSLEDID